MSVRSFLSKGVVAALALATVMAITVDSADARRRGGRGGGAAVGLAAGLIAGGIIASQAQPRYYEPRTYYYEPRPRRVCDWRWMRDDWGHRYRERVCWYR